MNVQGNALGGTLVESNGINTLEIQKNLAKLHLAQEVLNDHEKYRRYVEEILPSPREIAAYKAMLLSNNKRMLLLVQEDLGERALAEILNDIGDESTANIENERNKTTQTLHEISNILNENTSNDGGIKTEINTPEPIQVMPRASISPASNEEVNSEPMKKEVLSTKMKEFERTEIEAQELDKIGKQIAGDHAKEEIRKQQIENAQSIIASTQALGKKASVTASGEKELNFLDPATLFEGESGEYGDPSMLSGSPIINGNLNLEDIMTAGKAGIPPISTLTNSVKDPTKIPASTSSLKPNETNVYPERIIDVGRDGTATARTLFIGTSATSNSNTNNTSVPPKILKEQPGTGLSASIKNHIKTRYNDFENNGQRRANTINKFRYEIYNCIRSKDYDSLNEIADGLSITPEKLESSFRKALLRGKKQPITTEKTLVSSNLQADSTADSLSSLKIERDKGSIKQEEEYTDERDISVVTENPQLVFGKLHMKTKIFFGIKGENTFQLICNGFRSVSDEQKETSILELMKKNAPIDLGNDSSESGNQIAEIFNIFIAEFVKIAMSVNAEHEKNEQDFLDAQKADELLAKIKAQPLDLNLEEKGIAYNLVNDETPARKNDQVIIGQENRVQKGKKLSSGIDKSDGVENKTDKSSYEFEEGSSQHLRELVVGGKAFRFQINYQGSPSTTIVNISDSESKIGYDINLPRSGLFTFKRERNFDNLTSKQIKKLFGEYLKSKETGETTNQGEAQITKAKLAKTTEVRDGVKEKEDYFSYTGKKGASMLPYKYSVEVDDTEYKVYSIMTKKGARFGIKGIGQFEIEGKGERWAGRITEDIARAEIKKQLKENKRKETEPEIYYSGAPERFHSHRVNRTGQIILRSLMTKKFKGHYHGTDPISGKEFTSKTYYSNFVTGGLSSIRGKPEIKSRIKKFYESQMDAK